MNVILEGPINDALFEILGQIRTKQSQAKSQNGRYLQALASHDVVPDDGVSKDTRQMRKPDDQIDDLSIVVPPRMPVRVSVNVYAGPYGNGYDLVAEARLSGQLFRRVVSIGPERYREQEWVEVPDELSR